MIDDYKGIMFVGDPHLSSRIPGFRKDDYPNAILGKLKWCLEKSRELKLLPVLLGDIFHFPRDNANWLLVELFEMFNPYKGQILALTGNHDCFENELTSNDTLSIFARSGHLFLLDEEGPWQGEISGSKVTIGGAAWNDLLPKEYLRSDDLDLVFWVTHHDVGFSQDRESRYSLKEIPGVDVVVNGHIHTPFSPAEVGKTTWFNPGNISRVNRGDNSRLNSPSVLSMEIEGGKWVSEILEVPHEPFEEVFHQNIEVGDVDNNETPSAFVSGLAQLESIRTQSGAGLKAFLDENLSDTKPEVVKIIYELAEGLIDDD